MGITVLFSAFAHVMVVGGLILLPDNLFRSPPKIVAENRIILDVELVVDRGKTEEKQQIKTPKKVVNQKKAEAPQPKKIEPKKPDPPKKTTAKKVEKKAPVKKEAVKKVAPKKAVKKAETKPVPQTPLQKKNTDVLNTKKLLETTDKSIPQISDKKAEKSTKIYKEKAEPKKIINDVKQTEVKSKTEQNLVETVDPNQLMAQIGDQLGKCWSVPAGVPNAKNLVVTVYIKYNTDGTVQISRISTTNLSRSTTGMQQMIDAALRAVNTPKCNPLDLDPKSYDKWKEVEITFDPEKLLQ